MKAFRPHASHDDEAVTYEQMTSATGRGTQKAEGRKGGCGNLDAYVYAGEATVS